MQSFSRSAADGLEFYSARGTDGLQNVRDRAVYKKFNDLSDALNTNHPKEGTTNRSKDLRVLASFLHWLNTWGKGGSIGQDISNKLFNQPKAEGLHVTVLSALELSRYFLKSSGYKYVLTRKFNQNVLEQISGVICDVGGQKEHPSMPTFLQLYKMSSFCSLMKAPKFGNCEL